jgi:hypothetical protein
MTCQHPSGYHDNDYLKSPSMPQTPDASNYEIVDVQRVENHLVMKVLYPNCRLCAYEGNKVMVFLDVTEAQVLRWKKIDPHFRANSLVSNRSPSAPSPAARFPATPEGWRDALDYAIKKARK